MNAKGPTKGFSPEEYRRLAKNPFVDKNMLQFVREKTVSRRAPAGIPVVTSANPGSASGAGHPKQMPAISEKTARLVAITLKTMLEQR
jgi:hypothetical protein